MTAAFTCVFCCCFSESVTARPVTLEMAEVCAVHVVPVEFIEECQARKLKKAEDLVNLVELIKINPWNATAAAVITHLSLVLSKG